MTNSNPDNNTSTWNNKYFAKIFALAALWAVIYWHVLDMAHFLVYNILGLTAKTHLAETLEFFIYDTVKILMLLVALIYAIAWIRASLNVERVRNYLIKKNRGVGYFFGSMFGAITPFCSCSSIPLFLGFTMARIPVGITMSFLITSPLINEIAVVLLWGLLGWKFTLVYVTIGMSAGIIGGFVMDALKAERWLQPFVLEAMQNAPSAQTTAGGEVQKLTIKDRHSFAYTEMQTIFKRIWKWVILGVGIGAVLHGYVPANWFAENLGAGEWWTVPAAVFVGIPLYSNVTGIVPIMQSLLTKGLALGTTMAFCMSSVAASLPEVMLLRQIMTIKLQAAFIIYLAVILTLMGWLLNALQPYII